MPHRRLQGSREYVVFSLKTLPMTGYGDIVPVDDSPANG
jgi:hypothetical protein